VKTEWCPDLHITDAAGFAVSFGHSYDDDDTRPQRIIDMSEPLIADENTAKVLIRNITVDAERSIALKLLKKHRQYHNTIQVLTHGDVKASTEEGVAKIREMLLDDDLAQLMPTFVVSQRSGDDLVKGVSVADKIEWDRKHWESKGLSHLNTGMTKVRAQMHADLLSKSVQQLPEMEIALNKKLEQKKKKLSSIGKLSTGHNITRQLADEATEILAILNRNSPDRREIDGDVRHAVRKEVAQITSEAFHEVFGDIQPASEVALSVPDHSGVNNLCRGIVHNLKNIDPRDYELWLDTHRDGMLVNDITNEDIQKARYANILKSVSGAFFGFNLGPIRRDTDVYDEHDPRIKTSKTEKNRWFRKYHKTLNNMVQNHSISERARKVAVDTLLECIDEVKPETASEECYEFFKHLFDQIEVRTRSQALSDIMDNLVDKEKTLIQDINKLAWKLACSNYGGYDGEWKRSTFPLIHAENFPKLYPLYGEVWTDATIFYLIDTLSNDFCKTISEKVSQPLVRDFIEDLMENCKNFDYEKIASKMNLEIEELEKHKSTLNKLKEVAEKYNETEKLRREEVATILQRSKDKEEQKRELDRRLSEAGSSTTSSRSERHRRRKR
jgi:hypothetical protein